MALKRKDPLTVYMIECTGLCQVSGDPPNPFHEVTIYYLNNRTKRVYQEWILSHREDLDPTPTYIMSTGHRSIVECERHWHESADRMGKFFPSGVRTLVTKLGEL